MKKSLFIIFFLFSRKVYTKFVKTHDIVKMFKITETINHHSQQREILLKRYNQKLSGQARPKKVSYLMFVLIV